jgi:hypothetical protein
LDVTPIILDATTKAIDTGYIQNYLMI